MEVVKMDKKLLVGGKVIAGLAIASAIVIGISVYSAQKSGNNYRSDEPSQLVQEQGKTETNLTFEELILKNKLTFEESILKNKIEELLKNQAFYKGTVTIFEKQSWKSRGTDGSSGIGEATLTSEEILIFDKDNNKSYIVGRYLSYNSQHTVTVNDMNGKYLGTDNVSANGELTEFYGVGLLMKVDINNASASANLQNIFDFGMNPLRMDNKQKLIYTNPPPNKEEWVTYISIADTTRLGSARIFVPESRVIEILNLVPGLSNINYSRGYNKDETHAFEATNRFFIPVGTFSCDYKKITNEEAMKEIAKILDKIESEKLDKIKTEQDVSIKIDAGKGVTLHKDYPEDVIKIIDGAIVVVSEVIKEEGMTKNGFAVTLKTNLSIEEVLQFYKIFLKNVPDLNIFNAAGIVTLSGQKSGYEFSIMIMENSLGGVEKTMIQIMLIPL